MRVLRDVLYMLKRIGQGQCLGVYNMHGDREVRQNQRQEQRKSEMLSK